MFFIACVMQSNCANAQIEVVQAVTVQNKLETEAKVETPLVNIDYDFNNPVYETKTSELTKFEKKVRNYKAKKNQEKIDFSSLSTPAPLETRIESTIENNLEAKSQFNNERYQEDNITDRNTFKINADKITYDEKDGNIYAHGHVEIIADSQNVTLKGDSAVLERDSQIIKLNNNVKVIKGGLEMTGDNITVDLNEQNILMDNPTTDAYRFQINAQEGYIVANDLQMLNGTVKSAADTTYTFYSRGFMRFDPAIGLDFQELQDGQKATPFATKDTIYKDNDQSYKINAKEIIVSSYKEHNSITFKDADLYYNDHKIVRSSNFEFVSDKAKQTVETSIPEIGTLRSFGTYLGYGFLYKLPKGQTLKLMPALTLGNGNLGLGLMARHRAPNSLIEGGWNTSTTDFVVRGRYRFSDKVMLHYGRHAYIPEGFFGSRRAGYAAQMEYKNSYKIDDLDATFSHGIYAGLMSDYKKSKQESDVYATTRFRYMAQLSKQIFEYQNREQEFAMRTLLMSQAAATVYGSGETHGVFRIGPSLQTKFRRWDSAITYFITGIHGKSPFEFDEYRYGRSAIDLNEKFHLTDKFAFGFRLTISPEKDNSDNDLLTEARIYALFGPKDLKFALSYDFVRDIAHFDALFLLGTESSKINFDRLITKDIDRRNEKADFYKSGSRVKVVDPENI